MKKIPPFGNESFLLQQTHCMIQIIIITTDLDLGSS